MFMPRLEDCLKAEALDEALASVSHNMEDDFDAVGIAKCCQCGIRLPLDHASIEHHSRSCTGEALLPGSYAAAGTCYPCGTGGTGVPGRLSGRLRSSSDDNEPGRLFTSDVREILDSRSRATCSSVPAEREGDDEDPVSSDAAGLEWEDDFDAIGIAKCSHCGMKVALNDEAMEEHLRECKGEGRPPKPKEPPADVEYGRCCRCDQRISLEVDAVVAHSHVCPALRAERNSRDQVDCRSGQGWLSKLGLG